MKQYTSKWLTAITPCDTANRIGIIVSDKSDAGLLVRNIVRIMPRAQLVESLKPSLYNTLDLVIKETPIKVCTDGHAELIMPSTHNEFIDKCDIVIIAHKHHNGVTHYTTLKDMKD